MKKELTEYKKKYHAVRHHAWAGSVLLAVLLAMRLFLEISDISIDDRIILLIGSIVVVYTLGALFFTYKYRSGLSAEGEEKIVHIRPSPDELKSETIQADLEKECLKVEKKKTKAETKKAKKLAKEKTKQEKTEQ
jgi:hypothetical protein